MSESSPLFLLAAGGTGGHVYPAEALTRELLGRGARVELVTDGRGSRFSEELFVPVHRIQSCPFGRSLLGKIYSVLKMGFGVLQAAWLIHKTKPAAVVGFGGYPSVPLMFAAAHAGIPVILHEQNALLGRANATLLHIAKVLALSFSNVGNMPSRVKARKIVTGNPVRPAFSAMRQAPYPALTNNEPIRIFVLGGSLGARVFSTVVPKAVALLPQDIRRRLLVAQQCRAQEIEETRAFFAAAGVEADLSPFFKDVPERMAKAHIVISRAGGGSIAELTAVGRPAVLVPFTGGHAGEQTANARALAQAGGAWLIPEESFTPEALAVRLEALITTPATLAKAAAASRAWGTIAAADVLADCVYETAGLAAPKSRRALADSTDASGNEYPLALATREWTP